MDSRKKNRDGNIKNVKGKEKGDNDNEGTKKGSKRERVI